MTATSPRIFLLLDADLRKIFTAVLHGYDLEWFDFLETARQALAVKQYDLLIISNFGFRPGNAVDLIPHDHAYPVLFYSGFMDADLVAMCRAKRVHWCAVPFVPRTLLAEVVRALRTRAPQQDGGI